jgi:hypothetical protein
MDFLTDQNPKAFYKAATADLFPDFAAENWTQPEEVAGLAATAFADPARREFPVHTKVATVLSAVYAAGMPLYAADSDTDVPAVLERVKRAAVVHGIGDSVDKVIEHFASFSRKSAAAAAPQDMFALRGDNFACYPIVTQFDVSESARGIDEDFSAGRLPIKQARQAALMTMKRATELRMDPDYFTDTARLLGSDQLPDVETLRKHASWRTRITGDTAYEESAEFLCGDFSEEVKQACAEIWQELDSTHKVDIGPFVPPVPTVMFSGSSRDKFTKLANSYVWFGENMVPCPVVASLSEAVIKRAYTEAERPKVQEVVKAAFELRGEAATDLLATWDGAEVARLAQTILQQHPN